MTFETLRDNILSTLTVAAAGRYATEGAQVQKKSARENISLPRVTVYYKSGSFPKSSAALTSRTIHDVTFVIEMTVFVEHELDLSILNNPAATKGQKAAVLSSMAPLQEEASTLLDATWGIIYQVLMDAENLDFGLTKKEISDRWVDDFEKDSPASTGEYMTITGSATMTARVKEEITGETGTPGTAYDTTLNIKDDREDIAGASGTLGG